MPAKSKSQQRLMALALQVKQGDMTKDDFDDESFYKRLKKLADGMSKEDLEDYAETDRKNLPDKKEEQVLRNCIRKIIKEFHQKSPREYFKELDNEIDAMKYDQSHAIEYAKKSLEILENTPPGMLFDEYNKKVKRLYDIIEEIAYNRSKNLKRDISAANSLMRELGNYYEYE